FPNLLADYLLKPAWASIFPTLAQTNNLNVVINHWHGFNLELLMTISIFIFGIFLYVNLSKWRKIYNYYPQSLTLNNIYDQGILKTEAISRKITNRYMTDYIRDYLVYIFCFVIIVVGGSLWLSGGISFNSSHNASINFYEFALVIAMVAAAFAVLFSKSRLSSIIATSAIGFLVAAFFALFRAPDLALTQLVVETVTTVLFLLCFYHLPKLRKEFTRIRFKAVNACIAMGMGLIVTLTALSANGTRLFTSISSYFENSFELAGAKNIVNAILVDFRGFDTMLEILVLFIAGLGVFVLIKLRLPKGEEHEEIK
ncbi:MAG TPA: hydrogen gas-evolving membrane-bound hydrogenase subunit E, partial [Syntrophomonadaceae bacterium]|nr:hydrogen gas-evolving membrane-bound hydrogenase subunit E [Syntrophomonadaceae bacterium]